MLFKFNNRYVDVDLYGGSKLKKFAIGIAQRYIGSCQKLKVVRHTFVWRAVESIVSIPSLIRVITMTVHQFCRVADRVRRDGVLSEPVDGTGRFGR